MPPVKCRFVKTAEGCYRDSCMFVHPGEPLWNTCLEDNDWTARKPVKPRYTGSSLPPPSGILSQYGGSRPPPPAKSPPRATNWPALEDPPISPSASRKGKEKEDKSPWPAQSAAVSPAWGGWSPHASASATVWRVHDTTEPSKVQGSAWDEATQDVGWGAPPLPTKPTSTKPPVPNPWGHPVETAPLVPPPRSRWTQTVPLVVKPSIPVPVPKPRLGNVLEAKLGRERSGSDASTSTISVKPEGFVWETPKTPAEKQELWRAKIRETKRAVHWEVLLNQATQALEQWKTTVGSFRYTKDTQPGPSVSIREAEQARRAAEVQLYTEKRDQCIDNLTAMPEIDLVYPDLLPPDELREATRVVAEYSTWLSEFRPQVDALAEKQRLEAELAITPVEAGEIRTGLRERTAEPSSDPTIERLDDAVSWSSELMSYHYDKEIGQLWLAAVEVATNRPPQPGDANLGPAPQAIQANLNLLTEEITEIQATQNIVLDQLDSETTQAMELHSLVKDCDQRFEEQAAADAERERLKESNTQQLKTLMTKMRAVLKEREGAPPPELPAPSIPLSAEQRTRLATLESSQLQELTERVDAIVQEDVRKFVGSFGPRITETGRRLEDAFSVKVKPILAQTDRIRDIVGSSTVG